MSATALLNLSKAGFTEAQVTALAEYFDSQMATKADIADVRTELSDVRTELSDVRTELKADIADIRLEIEKLRHDLSLEIERVHRDLEVRIADIKADTIKWVTGLSIAQGAAVVALIRFLPGVHP